MKTATPTRKSLEREITDALSVILSAHKLSPDKHGKELRPLTKRLTKKIIKAIKKGKIEIKKKAKKRISKRITKTGKKK